MFGSDTLGGRVRSVEGSTSILSSALLVVVTGLSSWATSSVSWLICMSSAGASVRGIAGLDGEGRVGFFNGVVVCMSCSGESASVVVVVKSRYRH